MKRWAALLALLLLPLLPAAREIEAYHPAEVLALDVSGDVITLTLSLPGDDLERAAIVQGRGLDLKDARNDLLQAAQKIPLLPQVEFLLLGEGAEELVPAELLTVLDLRLETRIYFVSGSAGSALREDTAEQLRQEGARGDPGLSLGALLRQSERTRK